MSVPLATWKNDRPALFRGPNYYDSPEGQAPWEKLWGLSKYGIAVSGGMTLMDSLFYTQAQNFTEFIKNAGYWTVPMVGLSLTFASVTYISTSVRGKDDKVNYVIGAMACAPVLYAWKKTTSFTLYGTAILIAAAALKKDSVQNGWDFFGVPPREYSHYSMPDYSMVGEWPKRPI